MDNTSCATSAYRLADGSYDPNAEYYFVSYRVISTSQWVRTPFLTLAEMKDVLESLPMLLTPGMVPSSKSDLPGVIPDYENLQVYCETWLSSLRQDWDEETQEYVDSEFTNRQAIFDNRYELAAVRFTGIPSLSRQSGEDVDAWRQRVQQERSALKEKRIARMNLHHTLREYQDDLPSLLSLGFEHQTDQSDWAMPVVKPL